MALNTIKPNKKKPSSYYTTNQIGLLTLPPTPPPPPPPPPPPLPTYFLAKFILATGFKNIFMRLTLEMRTSLACFFQNPLQYLHNKLVSSPSFSSPIWWKLYGIALTQKFCILWDFHSTVKCSKNKIWLDIFFFFYFVREGWGTFLFTYNHFLLFLGLIIISLILTTHESMSNYNIKLYTVHLAMCKSHTNNF